MYVCVHSTFTFCCRVEDAVPFEIALNGFTVVSLSDADKCLRCRSGRADERLHRVLCGAEVRV